MKPTLSTASLSDLVLGTPFIWVSSRVRTLIMVLQKCQYRPKSGSVSNDQPPKSGTFLQIFLTNKSFSNQSRQRWKQQWQHGKGKGRGRRRLENQEWRWYRQKNSDGDNYMMTTFLILWTGTMAVVEFLLTPLSSMNWSGCDIFDYVSDRDKEDAHNYVINVNVEVLGWGSGDLLPPPSIALFIPPKGDRWDISYP